MKIFLKENLNKESGATAILTTVLIMSAVLSLSLLLTGAVIKNLNLSFDFTNSIQSFYAADAAVEKCVYQARKAAGDCMEVGGTANLTLSNGATAQASRESATIIESLGSLAGTNRKIRAQGNFATVVVDDFDPTSAVVGSTILGILVTGSGFEDGATVVLRQGDTEITPTTPFTFEDENTLSGGAFDLTLAELGDWDVVVENPDGQAGALTDGFTVTDLPPPSVSSISPSSGSVDTTISGVSISGNNFISGATAWLEQGGDILNPTTAFSFASSILLSGGSFNLVGANTGNWDVVVQNPSGESASLRNGFSINTVPSGWSGPYILKSGNNNCPGSYPSKSLYYTGCSAPGCSVSGGGYWLYEHINCGGWSYYFNSTSCDNGIYYAGHNDQVTSHRAQGCSCSSSGGSPQGTTTLCSGDGSVPGSWTGKCVVKSGNNNCPGSYPNKSLYYTGCSATSCSASGGGYQLYEHLNCGGWSYYFNSTSCDNGIYYAGHNDQVTSHSAQGCGCSASGGSPQGQITVCCQ